MYQRLPDFRMYDPYVSHEMTIRDLLTHRSGMGLGEGDLLFFPPTTYTREEIIHQLRYMKPASSFRRRFAYDNLLYMTAGQIIPAVTGTSWDEFVRQHIFAPLGMSHSNVSTAAFQPGDNVAYPHSKLNGKLQVIPSRTSTMPVQQVRSILPPPTCRSGCCCSSTGASCSAARAACSVRPVAGNVDTSDHPPDRRSAAAAGGPEGGFRGLCPRLDGARLSWPQAGGSPRRT